MDTIKSKAQSLYKRVFGHKCYISVSLIRARFPKFPLRPKNSDWENLFKKLLGFNKKWEVAAPITHLPAKKLYKGLLEIRNLVNEFKAEYGIYAANFTGIGDYVSVKLFSKSSLMGEVTYNGVMWQGGIGNSGRLSHRLTSFNEAVEALEFVCKRNNEVKEQSSVITQTEALKAVLDAMVDRKVLSYTRIFTQNQEWFILHDNTTKLGRIGYNSNAKKWVYNQGNDTVIRTNQGYTASLPALRQIISL